jgi:hypothetical protein
MLLPLDRRESYQGFCTRSLQLHHPLHLLSIFLADLHIHFRLALVITAPLPHGFIPAFLLGFPASQSVLLASLNRIGVLA